MMSVPKFFSLSPTRSWAEDTVKLCGASLEKLKEERFPDGEGKISLLEPVEGSHVVVFQSLAGEAGHSPFEKICELAFFLHSLRDQGAREITLIAPYLAFSRSDQRSGDLDPLYLKAAAAMLEGAGLSRIVTLDVHNLAAFENAFRFARTRNLEASSLFCDFLLGSEWKQTPLVVLSPDLGGIKRAEKFRVRLEEELNQKIGLAFLEKYRRGAELGREAKLELVKGALVLIYDDMISTGGTILRALDACEKGDAKVVTVLATHGIFSQKIEAILKVPLLRKLIVTDSNARLRSEDWSRVEKLEILSCASLLGQFLNEAFGGIAERRVA